MDIGCYVIKLLLTEILQSATEVIGGSALSEFCSCSGVSCNYTTNEVYTVHSPKHGLTSQRSHLTLGSAVKHQTPSV